MKIKGHNVSLLDNAGKLINMLMLSRMKENPVMVGLILNNCVIANADAGLAYTIYDNNQGFFRIFINFEFFENVEKHVKDIDASKKPYYLLFAIYHELTHHILKHFTRPKIREYRKKYPELVNALIDYHVNYFVDNTIGGGTTKDFIKKTGGIDYEMLDSIRKQLKIEEDLPFSKYQPPILEEQLIKWFLDRADKDEIEKAFKNIPMIGDHSKFKFEDDEIEEGKASDMFLDGKINIMMESAVREAGTSSGELYERWLEINKRDPYLDFIQVDATLRSLTRGRDRRTYSRINRHHPFSRILRKGATPDTLPPLCVLVDCSGSIGDEELKKFNEIMGGYVEKGGSLEVIYWSDCRITEKNFHRNITSWEQVRKLRPAGSGGTDISYAYDFIAEEYSGHKVTICVITDGYWTIEPMPKNVVKSYFVLTERAYKREIQEAYPGSIVKMIKVD